MSRRMHKESSTMDQHSLNADRPEAETTLVEKAYGVLRRAIVRGVREKGYGVRTLVHEVVRSELFRSK